MCEPAPPAASDRRRQAERDIEEVGRQLSEGELDSATAERLVVRYRNEISRIDGQETREAQIDAGHAGKPARARRLVGALLLLAVFTGVSVTRVLCNPAPRGGVHYRDPGGGVDLSQVTNDQMEAVIAANPDVPQIAAMRLRLADRYFEEGSFSAALPHYLGALREVSTGPGVPGGWRGWGG